MVPEIFLTLSPFLVLIAALWVVAGLRRQSELIPLLAAGVSPRRVAAPLLAMGVVLAPLVWLDREVVLPGLRELRRHRVLGEGAERPRPIPDQEGVFAPRVYLPGTREVRDVRYVRLDPAGRREVLTVLADRGAPAPGGWRLDGGFVVEADPAAPSGDRIAPIGSDGYLLATTIAPADVEASIDAPSYLSSRELRHQLERTPAFRHLAVQLYERMTYPLAGLVLLLLGLPIALGGDGLLDAFLRFLVCGALSVAYFLAMSVCSELGAREVLSPAAAALTPLLTFGVAGLLLTARGAR
jgi:lipopolysaccharide export system permease protein